MDELKIALLGAFGLLAFAITIGMLVAHEVKKGPGKKPNIRVPRETLWERTNRYHGSDT